MNDDGFEPTRKVERTIDVVLSPREMALLFANFHSGEQAEFFEAMADEVALWNGLGWCGQSCEIARVITARGAAIVAKLAEHVAASADTHPKDGDVKQAPLVSGAVGEAETPNA